MTMDAVLVGVKINEHTWEQSLIYASFSSKINEGCFISSKIN